MSREILIRVRADNPALLTGLDRWVQLGLLSDRYVREVASLHLRSILPPPVPEASPVTDTTVASKVASKAPNQEFTLEPLAAAPRSPQSTSTPPQPPLPAIPEVWQTLRDNFS
ncbi:MAG: hypothetical protein AAFY11_03840, partial [Cyanobacteria bacterium J06641_5]